eukprot:4111489-Pleurochrysis_carterae.AAC.2
MSSPAGACQIETAGAAAQALRAVSRAVQEAQRAYIARVPIVKSFQPPAGDLQSLDLVGSKRHAALSLFRLAAGRVVYMDGRDVACRRPSGEDGVDVCIAESTGGSTESIPAEALLQPSVKWLAGVVTVGKRKDAHALTLRARNTQATLSPCVDTPLSR